MYESFTEELIIARFTFRPERAAEFLEEPGRLVSQIEFESVEAIMDAVTEFGDAIVDANAIVNGKVINLTDYTLEDEE